MSTLDTDIETMLNAPDKRACVALDKLVCKHGISALKQWGDARERLVHKLVHKPCTLRHAVTK